MLKKPQTQQTKNPNPKTFKKELGSENTSAFTWLKFLFPPAPKWLVSPQNSQVFLQLDVFLEGSELGFIQSSRKAGICWAWYFLLHKKSVATLLK